VRASARPPVAGALGEIFRPAHAHHNHWRTFGAKMLCQAGAARDHLIGAVRAARERQNAFL